jgi:hypothetical protein
MGNESCCDSKKYMVDFNQCFDLKCVGIVIGAELKRINRISKDITFNNTINDNYAHSLFRERNPEEMKTFFYYLKLEMILTKIKHYIEESTIPMKYLLKREPITLKKQSTMAISSIPKLNIKDEIPENEKNPIDSELTDKKQTQPTQRTNKRSHTTKAIFSIKKQIDLNTSIKLLTEIMQTEEHYNEEILIKLGNSIENRLFD